MKDDLIITKDQLSDLEDAQFFDEKEFHKLLEEYTGIRAESYTGYSYYDSAGNYLGDDHYCDIKDILNAAYIKVED